MAQPTPTPGNPDVIKYWAGLYGQTKHSDCMVVFMLDRSPLGGQAAEPGTSEAGPSGPGQPADRSVAIGEPLPAHSWMLCPACDKWNQQWETWTSCPDSDGPASKRRKLLAGQAVAVTITVAGEAGSAASAAAAASHVPEIRVAVRSEEDVPAALAVVKFAYTGLVEAGSIREALRVWKQADYQQMRRCMEACLERVREKLAGTAGAAGGGSSAAGGGGGGSSNNESSSDIDAVLELYSCTQLWPDPANDPTYAAFAALLTEAKRRLVAHFGDALAVLNKKHLHKQMVALPAMGLEALLESDDFGTDSESSVVLVLAEWMQVNCSRTDAATRRRLCGLLRLVQCSRAYLDWVLPALALDHYDHPDSPAGWLPITPEQAGWLSKYVGASEAFKKVLWDHRTYGGGFPDGWLNDKPRRQCVPPAGLTFTFSVSQKNILDELANLRERQVCSMRPEIDASPGEGIWAVGLEWYLVLEYEQGHSNASIFLTVRVPDAYAVKAGTVLRLNDLHRPTEMLRANLYLHQWCADGRRQKDVLAGWFVTSEVSGLDTGLGVDIDLSGSPARPAQPALVQQQAGGQQEVQEQVDLLQQQEQLQQRQAREAAVAAQWAAYLKDGELTGEVVVLPPS